MKKMGGKWTWSIKYITYINIDITETIILWFYYAYYYYYYINNVFINKICCHEMMELNCGENTSDLFLFQAHDLSMNSIYYQFHRRNM